MTPRTTPLRSTSGSTTSSADSPSPFFALHAAFPIWRFIHMQHHRFTNHDDGSDPDPYTMPGPAWQLPLRWLTVDLRLPRLLRCPKLRKRRRAGAHRVDRHAGIASSPLVRRPDRHRALVELLVLLFVPSGWRSCSSAWAFDYLPHHGLHHTPSEDKLKTTRNRVGAERVLSPLLLYQNYHLVHHLHPVVPFYRYLAVWRRNEDRTWTASRRCRPSAAASSRPTSTAACASSPTTPTSARPSGRDPRRPPGRPDWPACSDTATGTRSRCTPSGRPSAAPSRRSARRCAPSTPRRAWPSRGCSAPRSPGSLPSSSPISPSVNPTRCA